MRPKFRRFKLVLNNWNHLSGIQARKSSKVPLKFFLIFQYQPERVYQDIKKDCERQTQILKNNFLNFQVDTLLSIHNVLQ